MLQIRKLKHKEATYAHAANRYQSQHLISEQCGPRVYALIHSPLPQTPVPPPPIIAENLELSKVHEIIYVNYER